MKPENKAFLDANRHHHDTLTKALYMKGLNAAERDGMQRVMREEFIPGYHTDLWCPPCVSDMVKLLYQKYDAWLAAQPKEETKTDEPIIIHATFPKQEPNEQNPSDSVYTPHSSNRPKRNHRRR